MGRILPRKKFFKSLIYSPKLHVGSHIDNVKNSLDRFIFTNEKEVEHALMKKRIKVVVVITILFMIVGSVLSPKGQAEIATFYPTSCLGGWVNPSNAEGEFQTNSNDDEKSFTRENSSILPATTSADIYCGNFKGTTQENTKPTKIIISLAWSVGDAIVVEQNIRGDSFASSSQQILDTLSTTDISFTLQQATTSEVASSTPTGSDTASGTDTLTPVQSDVTTSTTMLETSQATNREINTSTSIIDKVVEVVEATVQQIFGNDQTEQNNQPTQTAPPSDDGAVKNETTPEIQPTQEGQPTSLLDVILQTITMYFVKPVLALETQDVEMNEVVSSSTDVTAQQQLETSAVIEVDETSTTTVGGDNTTPSALSGTSTEIIDGAASTTTDATSSSIIDTTLDVIFDQNSEDESPNNFLEILYTFDGTVWKSLGKVNESSMKYRTFEIPVTATTSWNDLQQLQIKVQPLHRIDAVPTVYLDGIKMEVLYETPVIHPHPDFVRDTILKDKSDEGLRVINIINSDTNNNEVWYTTIETQGNYGVAPGTWVRVSLDQVGPMYKLIDMYGQNVFLVDESNKLLWVTDLQHSTNNGIGFVEGGSTTVIFTKANGEEWLFEYNQMTKVGVARPKI